VWGNHALCRKVTQGRLLDTPEDTTPQLTPITVDASTYLVPQTLAKAYERGPLRPEG